MATTIIDAILIPILGCFTTHVIDSIRAKFRVLRNLSENMEELENTRLQLEARRSDKEREVEEEMNQRGVVKSEVADLWFTQVADALSEANNLRIDCQEQSQISGSSCPNCFRRSRYQLSNRASKLKQNVLDRLLAEEPRSGWTRALSRQIGRNMNTVSIEGQTKKLKDEIIGAVLDDRHVVVGLHGMGGIGKTTLLRHANEHFRMNQHFESVIFTTVSSTPNFEEIRKQIAGCFGLKNRQDDDDLKEQLSRLFETRKYLLILDDMWETVIDLDKICNIPRPKKENGSKILMASRSISVAIKFVIGFGARDSLRCIQVNKLQPDEAWNLFVQKVGEDITSKAAVKPLAKDVVKKCDGLPLAIVVIGGTMSTRETEGEWKDALRELEQSASNLEGMEKVFSILLVSFEKLEPIEQSLFLYCCLFPEDYSIDKEKLVDFAIGEETLSGMHRLKDIRNKVDVLAGKLRNSSMLEDGSDFGEFKMHDMMRELALWITSTSNKYLSNKFITKVGVEITEAPDASEWCKATKISLMNNYRMESLPQLPDQCPQLHTLLFSHCYSIKDIRQLHFLEHMPALQMLDLSSCYRVEHLPPSISHLVNLRMLNLSYCSNLQDLPHGIGMLVQLISLNLRGCSSLKTLPMEMKKLNNLRRLDISYTNALKRIPRGVLSGLHKLEELYTIKSGIKWYKSGVEELSQLINLIDVSIEIRTENVFHWFKPFLKSKRIGSLELWNCTIDTSILPYLLDIDGDLRFKSCKGLTHFPTHGCERRLTIQACPDLKAVLTVEEAERNAFERLQRLNLYQLDQLQTICTGISQPGCFSNMTSVKIQECPNLKVIFTNGITRLLKNLHFLWVHRCPQLVKIVEDEDLEINAFPNLKEMYLCELPELTAICHLDLNWPSLFEVQVYLCSKLKRPLFGNQHADIVLSDEMDHWMTMEYLVQKELEEVRGKEEEEEEDDDHEDEEEENEGVL